MEPDESGTDLPPGLAVATGWQGTLLIGIITFVLGLIVTLRPSGSLNVIAVLIGLLMVISGLFHLLRVFGSGEEHRVWHGIAGLLLVVIRVMIPKKIHQPRPSREPPPKAAISVATPSTIQLIPMIRPTIATVRCR